MGEKWIRLSALELTIHFFTLFSVCKAKHELRKRNGVRKHSESLHIYSPLLYMPFAPGAHWGKAVSVSVTY